MAWKNLRSNLTISLSALSDRFPYANAQELTKAKEEPIAMTRIIAKSHDLTMPEAREELENFLDIQSLARAAADFRSHDAELIDAD